jgi:hypothetical protein
MGKQYGDIMNLRFLANLFLVPLPLPLPFCSIFREPLPLSCPPHLQSAVTPAMIAELEAIASTQGHYAALKSVPVDAWPALPKVRYTRRVTQVCICVR